MRTVLITGGAGFLGQALIRLAPPGIDLHATQRRTPVHGCAAHTVDLADADAASALLDRVRPELIIHTAYSYTEGERDILLATRNLVEAAAPAGIQLICLSTDVLLSGEAAPYDESAEPDPVFEYGRWKAEAERLVRDRAPGAAVVRTSLLTCFEPLDPRSARIADALRSGEPMDLYTDELRCPIAVDDLALQLWEVAGLPAERRGGVWHLVGPEAVSRYTMGTLIAAHLGLSAAPLRPSSLAASPTRRPGDLRLLTARADRELRTRARPVSALVRSARVAGVG